MSKLHDMVAFGEEQGCPPSSLGQREICVLRAALRWMLAVALVGLVFSGVMTYREYTTPDALVCAPLGPSGTPLGLPPCVYGLALYAALVAIAAVALARTRGSVGDELVATSL